MSHYWLHFFLVLFSEHWNCRFWWFSSSNTNTIASTSCHEIRLILSNTYWRNFNIRCKDNKISVVCRSVKGQNISFWRLGCNCSSIFPFCQSRSTWTELWIPFHGVFKRREKKRNRVWLLGHRSAGASFPKIKIWRQTEKHKNIWMSNCSFANHWIALGTVLWGDMTRLSVIQFWGKKIYITVHLFENVS